MHHKQLWLPQFRLIPSIMSHIFWRPFIASACCQVLLPQPSSPPSLNLSTLFQFFVPLCSPFSYVSFPCAFTVSSSDCRMSLFRLPHIPHLSSRAGRLLRMDTLHTTAVFHLGGGAAVRCLRGRRGFWVACSTMKTYQ